MCLCRADGADNQGQDGRAELHGGVNVLLSSSSERVADIRLKCVPFVPRVSLKQSLSLLELEQHLSWIRAEVEADAGRPLSSYMLADDQNALADQVAAG